MSGSQSQSETGFTKPSDTEVQAMVRELLPRSEVQGWVRAAGKKLYWRLLTPLVLRWGLIYQRLAPDHTCDEVVSHLRAGGADHLDPADADPIPLSQRLRSESMSAYVQGRNRLPLGVIQSALRHVYQTIRGWLRQEQQTWKGHAVRWLDGTTMRLRPVGDLAATYGQAKNQHGVCYWVVARVVAAFCLHSEAVVGAVEASSTPSEAALVRDVMKQDPEPGSIYMGDQGLGVYRVAQVGAALGHPVVLRVGVRTAKKLWQTSSRRKPLVSGSEHWVQWAPEASTRVDPELPREAVPGRLLYVRIERDGFRPVDLYLFTTLLDAEVYPLVEVCALYGQRWQVEIDLRQIKTTLEMEQFEVKSAALFRKELIAGLLTYNLIRAYMVRAALHAGIEVRQLSFSRCWRRIRQALTRGLPAWVRAQGHGLEHLLTRLAQCTLPPQRNKVRCEPRQVRRKPAVFPQLRGSRADARKEVLKTLAAG
jgi:hypothetical protein